ncbi:hypothetical protein BDW60DRAFT_177383 [Aspergillus nidulans var. acristatus]
MDPPQSSGKLLRLHTWLDIEWISFPSPLLTTWEVLKVLELNLKLPGPTQINILSQPISYTRNLVALYGRTCPGRLSPGISHSRMFLILLSLLLFHYFFVLQLFREFAPLSVVSRRHCRAKPYATLVFARYRVGWME